jgi:hypothetical protein
MPTPRDVADGWVGPQLFELGLEVGAGLGTALDQILPLEDFDVFEGGGAGDGVAAEGQQVAERGGPLLLEHLVDMLGDDGRGERRVTGGNPLGHRHDVRHEPELLGGEHGAGATEAVDHLVGDQQDAVLRADLAEHLPVDG